MTLFLLHTKKSKICNIPCITYENGQRLGLFFGRIGQWQNDEEKIVEEFHDYIENNIALIIRKTDINDEDDMVYYTSE